MKRFYRPKLLPKPYMDFSATERRFRDTANRDPDCIPPLLVNLERIEHAHEHVAQGMMDAVMRGLQGTRFDDVRYGTARLAERRWIVRLFNIPEPV